MDELIWSFVTAANIGVVVLFASLTLKAMRVKKYVLMFGSLTAAFIFLGCYHFLDHMLGFQLIGQLAETFAIICFGTFVFWKMGAN